MKDVLPMRNFALPLTAFLSFGLVSTLHAADLKEKDAAPVFKLKTQADQLFDLSTRTGQWTVLYFYPKSGTPGCTKQACAFRDNIKKIRAEGAEVFGISTNSVKDQAAFYAEHKLNFDLLADEDGKVGDSYGVQMMITRMSKRWTFIIDPELKIAKIMKDVDPVIDSVKIADDIAALKKAK